MTIYYTEEESTFVAIVYRLLVQLLVQQKY